MCVCVLLRLRVRRMRGGIPTIASFTACCRLLNSLSGLEELDTVFQRGCFSLAEDVILISMGEEGMI